MEHKIGPTRCGCIRKYGYPDLLANDSYGTLHPADVELGETWLRVGKTMNKLPTFPPRTSEPTAPHFRRIWGRTTWPTKEKEAEFLQVIRDDTVIMLSKGLLKDRHGTA